MSYAIVLAPEAVEDLEGLKANVRAVVRAAIETHLRHSQQEQAAVGLKGYAGSDAHNIDCAWTIFAFSTIFLIRPWKSSQS